MIHVFRVKYPLRDMQSALTPPLPPPPLTAHSKESAGHTLFTADGEVARVTGCSHKGRLHQETQRGGDSDGINASLPTLKEFGPAAFPGTRSESRRLLQSPEVRLVNHTLLRSAYRGRSTGKCHGLMNHLLSCLAGNFQQFILSIWMQLKRLITSDSSEHW